MKTKDWRKTHTHLPQTAKFNHTTRKKNEQGKATKKKLKQIMANKKTTNLRSKYNNK